MHLVRLKRLPTMTTWLGGPSCQFLQSDVSSSRPFATSPVPIVWGGDFRGKNASGVDVVMSGTWYPIHLPIRMAKFKGSLFERQSHVGCLGEYSADATY